MPIQMKGKPLLPENQKNAYNEFYESTANDDILDQKTTLMIQLATSFAMGCYP
jgi:hypothetical protein